MSTCIIWFRRDLRLEDNDLISMAVENGQQILPVYMDLSKEAGEWAYGGASRWWLHGALEDLGKAVGKHGGNLFLFRSCSLACMRELFERVQPEALYSNYCPEPWIRRFDKKVESLCLESGVRFIQGSSNYLQRPDRVYTKTGNPFKVFTPFSRAFEILPVEHSANQLDKAVFLKANAGGVTLDELQLESSLDWKDGLAHAFERKRSAALKRLDTFRDQIASYDAQRDIPGVSGTSGLSPYLHFGQIGVREILKTVLGLPGSKGRRRYYLELLWREFAAYILYHFDETPSSPLDKRYNRFVWREDSAQLEAWKKGMTGYPIVDAGMRQLWETGWMHNRVRMIVGSFLVKHLLISWTEGAQWFWDCLVDADLASNTLGWQWVGGCGADAAPFFRIFNPILQSKKFDPNGDYIRRYIPELSNLSAHCIHAPWELPEDHLEAAGIRLGVEYPKPIIDLKEGRERALEAFRFIKE